MSMFIKKSDEELILKLMNKYILISLHPLLACGNIRNPSLNVLFYSFFYKLHIEHLRWLSSSFKKAPAIYSWRGVTINLFLKILSTHSNEQDIVSSHRLFQFLLLIFPSPPDHIGEGLYLLNKTVPSSVPPCFRKTNKSRNLRERSLCAYFLFCPKFYGICPKFTLIVV